MGLKSNQMTAPDSALFPTGTPVELKALGHDLRQVHSCAIPEPGRIRGCVHAVECSLRKFGLVDEGGFGPPDTEPGTPGQGPRNIGYYLRTHEGDWKEDFIRCSAYMTVLLNRENKQEETGEELVIVAQEGEPIEVTTTVPVEPKLCNKTGNYALKTETNSILVPVHARPGELDKRNGFRRGVREDRLRKMRERRRERAGYGEDALDDAGTDDAEAPAVAKRAAAPPRGPRSAVTSAAVARLAKSLPGAGPKARPTNKRRSAAEPVPNPPEGSDDASHN